MTAVPNHIVARAFAVLGLKPGTPSASGYVSSEEDAASGVKWWAYAGPDKVRERSEFLQFGVKVNSNAAAANLLRKMANLTERGGSTFYFDVSDGGSLRLDQTKLEAAHRKIKAVLASIAGG